MNRFKNILCIMEPTGANNFALERAVTLAENNQASLTLIDVIPQITAGIGMPEGGPVSAELQSAMNKNELQKLHSLTEPYKERIEITTKILVGVPFLEIIREVLRNNHDLIIKEPETQKWLERIFGSDDMHLLRKCPCPVWLVKPQTSKSYRHILAAVDFDDTDLVEKPGLQNALNQQILQLASSIALSNFAELHIVHVWDAIGESSIRSPFIHTPEKQIKEYVKQTKQQHANCLDKAFNEVTSTFEQKTLDYINPQKHLIKGHAEVEISALAQKIEADLVVMGTVVRTGIAGFIMGNTAESILNQLHCSVLAIKPPGFLTPVTLED